MLVCWVEVGVWMGVGCPCPPVRNDIVTPRQWRQDKWDRQSVFRRILGSVITGCNTILHLVPASNEYLSVGSLLYHSYVITRGRPLSQNNQRNRDQWNPAIEKLRVENVGQRSRSSKCVSYSDVTVLNICLKREKLDTVTKTNKLTVQKHSHSEGEEVISERCVVFFGSKRA